MFFHFWPFSHCRKVTKMTQNSISIPSCAQTPKNPRKMSKTPPYSGLGAKPFLAPPAKADIATAILTNVIEHLVLLFCPPISTPSPPKRCGRIWRTPCGCPPQTPGAWLRPSRPATQSGAAPGRPTAPKGAPEPAQYHKCHHCQAKRKSMSPSAAPATQSEDGCRQVPCLPRKAKVDVAKCQACHAKCKSMSPSATPATPPRKVKVDVAKCHVGVCVCVWTICTDVKLLFGT